MEAIEFQTTLGNDGIISVPQEMGDRVKRGPVRVIVIEAEGSGEPKPDASDIEEVRNYINYLMEHPFKVDRSVPLLTRDEIYDRRI